MTDTNPTPTPTPQKSKLATFAAANKKLLIVAGVALVIGTMAGNGAANSKPAPPAPAAQVITKTETVTNNVTPASCITALNNADSLNGVVAQVFNVLSESVTALVAGDYSLSKSKSAEAGVLNGQMKSARATYELSAAQCRADKASA